MKLYPQRVVFFILTQQAERGLESLFSLSFRLSWATSLVSKLHSEQLSLYFLGILFSLCKFIYSIRAILVKQKESNADYQWECIFPILCQARPAFFFVTPKLRSFPPSQSQKNAWWQVKSIPKKFRPCQTKKWKNTFSSAVILKVSLALFTASL